MSGSPNPKEKLILRFNVINFKKYNNRSWKDLNDIEKKEWKDFANEYQDFLQKWARLCSFVKCWLCKRFKEPLIIKMPYDTEMPFYKRLNYKFLVHIKITHGIGMESILYE